MAREHSANAAPGHVDAAAPEVLDAALEDD